MTVSSPPAAPRAAGSSSAVRARSVPWARVATLTGAAVLILCAAAGAVWGYPAWRAASLLSRAQDALARDEFGSAREHLERLIALRPDRADGHTLLARACRRAGDLAAAREHLTAARRLKHAAADPETAGLDFEERLLAVEGGWSHGSDLIGQFQAGHFEEELILEALAKGFLARERWGDAAAWAGVWLERYPDNPLPLLYRGRARQMRGLFALAVADYRQVLEARPGRPEARLWLGTALAADGHFAEARAHFEDYLAAHPGDAQALLGLAYCRLSLNDPDGARSAAIELLARAPGNAAALLVRGQADLAADRPDDALAWLRRAEAAAPHETDTLTALAAAYRRLGRDAEAADYEARLKDVRSKVQRIADLARALGTGRETNHAAGRHEGARLLLGLGRDAEALEWWALALRHDPNHAPSHRALGDYWEKQGDAARAAAHRRLARGEP